MGKKRAILIVALIAVVGGGAAAYFTGGGSSESGADSIRTTNVGANRSATSTDSLVAEITSTIYQIERLRLDPAIFNSPAFRVLQDRTQVIPPEVPGRENPFAPLYSDGRSTTTGPRPTRPGAVGGLLNNSRTGTGATGTAPTLRPTI